MKASRPPTFTKPLLATLLLAILTTLTTASASVSHFTLLDARTGKTIRKLKDGDRITTTTPITIAAIPKIRVKNRIVFAEPFPFVSRTAPYTLSANARTGYERSRRGCRERCGAVRRTPLRLSPKLYRISAYVDDASAVPLSIRIMYRPLGFPDRGPVPRKGELGLPAPPPVKKACVGEKPVISSFRLDEPEIIFEVPWTYSAKVTYCTAAGQKLRMRLMSIRYKPASKTGGKGTVLTKKVESFKTSKFRITSNYITTKWCGETLVYLEACAVAASGNPVCATSEMASLPPREVDEPLLAFRPPIKLQLAPGDEAKVVMRVTENEKRREGLLNGGNQKGPFTLASIVEAEDKYIVKETALKLSNVTVAKMSADGRSRGVTLRDNGSKVYLKFARPDCKLNFGTYKEPYSTELVVSTRISPLVKQDTKLPTFDQPKYPPTVFKEPVTITVRNAKNVGGGRRADGTSPELHYQWYVRRMNYASYNTYAEPILGATGPSLPLGKADCSKWCFSRWFVIGLREFYVDVCNTFGCRRSEKILPKVLAPPLKPGQKWDSDNCVVKGRSYGCDADKYCMVGKVVKRCP